MTMAAAAPSAITADARIRTVMDLSRVSEAVVSRACMLAAGSGRALLGIAGPPGVGKSTLAAAVAAAVNRSGVSAALLPMDGFHLADRELARLGRLPRKGAIDTFDGDGYLAILRRIRRAAEPIVYAPAFERDLEQPLAGAIPIPREAQLVVTEGNYLLDRSEPWSAVAGELAEIWFCDSEPVGRRERLIARHVRFGKSAADAQAWVRDVDDINAERIIARRDAADRGIAFDPEAGWSFAP